MIIVDTSFYIGLIDSKDQWHKNAIGLKEYVDEQDILVTDLIISEVLTEVGKRKGGKVGHLMYNYFKDNCRIHISSEEDLDFAESIYLKYDGKLSLSDSLIVHCADQFSINTIVSFDSDFDKTKNIFRISS